MKIIYKATCIIDGAEAARCVKFYYDNAVCNVDKISNGYQFVEKV
jgi:hypothetical protein